MGSVADAFDNAVAESFFATLKCELLYRHPWPRREDARRAIFEFIEAWYNPRRRHSTLGFVSPAEYERRYAMQAVASRRRCKWVEWLSFAFLAFYNSVQRSG